MHMKVIDSDSYISVSDVCMCIAIFLKCCILVLFKISGMKMNKISSDFDLGHRYIFFSIPTPSYFKNNMMLVFIFFN